VISPILGIDFIDFDFLKDPIAWSSLNNQIGQYLTAEITKGTRRKFFIPIKSADKILSLTKSCQHLIC